eukprot:jgi/Psemu1/35776/gm1.35776_g
MEFHVVDKQQAAFLAPKTAAAAAKVAPASIMAAAADPDKQEVTDLPSSPGLNTLGMYLSMLDAPNILQSAKKDCEKIDPIVLAVEVYPSTPIKPNRSSSNSPTRDPPADPPRNSPIFRSPKLLSYVCISTITKSFSSFQITIPWVVKPQTKKSKTD